MFDKMEEIARSGYAAWKDRPREWDDLSDNERWGYVAVATYAAAYAEAAQMKAIQEPAERLIEALQTPVA